MKRRRYVSLAVGAIVLAAACAETTATTTSGAAPTTTSAPLTSTSSPPSTVVPTTSTTVIDPGLPPPRHGGEAIIGNDQEPPTLNPYVPGGDNEIVSIIGSAVWAGVWELDAGSLQPVPDAVAELPNTRNGGVTVNDDGTMTVRYRLRDDAVWDDRTPISGHDLEFTYETLAGLQFPGRYPLDGNVYETIIPDTVKAGDKTFEFTLAEPTIQYELMFPIIMPRHAVAGTDYDEDWNDTMWPSGGPFRFESFDRRENTLTLTRNPNYWRTDPESGAQLPYLDRVVFHFIPETDELIQAFLDREVDIITVPPRADTVAAFAGVEGTHVDLREGPIWEHLSFQFGRNNPNEDSLNRHVEFRRAIAHAIDRRAIVDAGLWLAVAPLHSYTDYAAPGLSTVGWDRYEYDPDEARRLLAGLCARLERDCTADPPVAVFTTTDSGERPRLAELLEPMLTDVGIEVEVQIFDALLLFGGGGFGASFIETGRLDLGAWAWVASPGLVGLRAMHAVFDPDGAPPHGQNFYRWGTPAVVGESEEFDQGVSTVVDEHTARVADLLRVVDATANREVLFEAFAEIEEIIADQAVIIPLVARASVGVVWQDEIARYRRNAGPGGDLWNVEEWYRVDR